MSSKASRSRLKASDAEMRNLLKRIKGLLLDSYANCPLCGEVDFGREGRPDRGEHEDGCCYEELKGMQL